MVRLEQLALDLPPEASARPSGYERGVEARPAPDAPDAHDAHDAPATPPVAHASATSAPAAPSAKPFAVELRRGSRRRRHVEGVLRNGTFVVSYPPRMALAEAERIADELAQRMAKRVTAGRIDLRARARRLARDLDLPLPARIEWSSRQTSLWGSCQPGRGIIRISERLAEFPRFVLDYVIVHELAHLVEPDHGPRFHALVARYPRSERAIGFLIAKDLAPDDV